MAAWGTSITTFPATTAADSSDSDTLRNMAASQRSARSPQPAHADTRPVLA